MEGIGRKQILVFGAALMLFAGCSSQEEKNVNVRQLNQNPLDRSEASALVLEKEPVEDEDLLKEIFSMNGGEEDKINYEEIGESTGNGKDFFYTKSCSEKMDEFSSYLNQVYRYDSEQGQSELLYETKEAIWLNELTAAADSIFWVEYLPGEDGNFVYHVMRLDLDTGDTECIAVREDSQEICLSGSDAYVTWYDLSLKDDSVNITVYDVEKQEFLSIEDNARLAAPYGRLDIVEGGITYFSEDESGNLYINRYDLVSKEKESLLLGAQKDYDKRAGCFSDSRYIGWYERDDWGPYYLYHIESGTLYRMEPPEGMNVFAATISAGRFYVLSSTEHALYVCDPVSGETLYQKLPQDCTGLRFYPWQDGGLVLNAHAKGKDILFSVGEGE